MTTSNEPKRPRDRAASRPAKKPAKGFKTPLSRRLKYLAQDAGYALKKLARRATDPLRDASLRRGAGGGSGRGTHAAGRAHGGSRRSDAGERGRRAGESGRRKRPRLPTRRRPGRASEPGARHLGERPAGHPRRSGRRRPALPGRSSLPSRASIAAAITRFGERSSILIRRALAPVGRLLAAIYAAAARVVDRLARAITPLRATIAVTALAAVLLGLSQFVDYRGVAVGQPDYSAYSDVQAVAPAPQIDRKTAGSAHAYLLLPLALVALAALYAAVRGRWQLGRVVSLCGLAGIAVALFVDAPAGLAEGEQSVAYAGAQAELIEGFYAELCSAAVILVGGLLISRYARLSGHTASRPRRRAPKTLGQAKARPA